MNCRQLLDSGHLICELVLPVSRFLMSKYPVTNQQFDYFIRAEDGYSNRHWWTYSDAAFHWYKTHEQPLESRFSGDERPRENISWYEAMAFCNWLSHYTGGSITLPTLAQWQYAAQGRDNRFFPWGNTYHPDICNTHESGLKMTTEVTRYDDGKSPFGVYDMAGNVWEWCLDTGEPDDEQSDEKRAVTGGSYVSPYDRAKITFHYFLNPESRFSSIGFRIVALS
jgi:formylglycine-generating enzyme required for sulfatase activity